ncbi:SGNH/GDSL hydrolase family protein [Mycobacterium sp. C31M]
MNSSRLRAVRLWATVAAVALVVTGCQRPPDNYTSTYTPPATSTHSTDGTEGQDSECSDPSTLPAAPATRPGTQRVTVIGDSYLSTPPVPFPDLIWQEFDRRGPKITATVGAEGGTGYTNCGASAKTIYLQRVDRLVSPNDALIVFIGGRNDRYTSPPVLELVVRDTFARAREIAPSAELLVIGPIFPGDPPAAIGRVSETLRHETEAASGTYVDPVELGWLSEDNLTKEDGVHPNEAGNQYLANKIGPLIAAQLSA